MSVRTTASLLTLGCALAATLAAPGPGAAQMIMGGGFDRYSGRYGDPVEVALEDLARGFGYSKRAVITQGVLDMMDGGQQYFRLRDEGAEVLVLAVPNAYDDVRRLLGREVEVVGLVREVPYRQQCCREAQGGGCMMWQSQCDDPDLPALPNLEQGRSHWPNVSITIWGITDMTPPPGTQRKREYKGASLESLVMNPGDKDGQTVRVIGQFRGKNLYGDLPIRSQKGSSDWVIKDDAFAVWVTGKKPKGSGWQLDTGLKRDTGRWLEVVGRVQTVNGVTYLRAVQVALASAPSPTATVEAPPPPPERPKVPPVVVFSLPLDGEEEVATDSRFVVQFSKDMDENTFAGRVMLRYSGPVLPGDRAFDGVTLAYDGGRRALTVDPRDVLRPGRSVELLLLPGILDVDGLPLTPRPGRSDEMAELAIDVFTNLIGG
ncbi:MAG TPA: Ig-like domain-containing protein [Vicinamibacteria bacterium]|nr:Ig-like domain-containing protein [Vicinamibacteria bacterium]